MKEKDIKEKIKDPEFQKSLRDIQKKQLETKLKSEKKGNFRGFLADLIWVTIGCIISAFSINAILIPNGLSSGGITGAIRIVQKFYDINFALFYYSIAMIILLTCFLLLGWKEARKIILMSVLYPSIIAILDLFPLQLLQHTDLFLAAVYYGVIAGIGAGIIFKRGYSFGGTDTIAKILHKKIFKFVSISQILLFIDAVVIIGSAFVYGKNVAMYALVSQVILVRTIDFVMFGFDSKFVKVEIITNNNKAVEAFIIENLGRGVSRIKVVGAFTNEEKTKLSCICSTRESMLLKNFVAKIDGNAFMDVTRVEAVWGMGIGFEELEEKK